MKSVQLLVRGFRSLMRRLKNQGIRHTLVWLHGRGTPLLTGIPVLRYSRVTASVHVGAQHGAAGKRFLERRGIHHSVSLRAEMDDAERGLALAHYCYLPTVDGEAPTLQHLREGVAFIAWVVEKGGKVYIHCEGGVGGAPTMAAAYLIYLGHSVDSALALIRAARPFIDLSSAQMQQLARFEEIQRKDTTR